MKWYYHIAGGHTHVAVFMNGAKCGDLCFRNEEFEEVKRNHSCMLSSVSIDFIHKAENGYPLSHVEGEP